MLRVGMISYFPDNEIRSKRITEVTKTFKDLRVVIPEEIDIHIIAQNYGTDGPYDIEGFTYTHITEGIGQCAARNQLLAAFYDSDDDFLMYADDDTAFYDRYNAVELFQRLHSNPEWFELVDCFTGLEGRFTPFTAENEKLGLGDSTVGVNNSTRWVWKPMQFATSGEFRVIRNLKKYYGKEFYYDSDLKYGEDLHFRLKYLSQINSYVCRNLILRSRGMGDDICTLDRMSQLEQSTFYNQVTQDVYNMFNISVNSEGRADLSAYRGKIPYYSVNVKDGLSSLTPGKVSRKLF